MGAVPKSKLLKGGLCRGGLRVKLLKGGYIGDYIKDYTTIHVIEGDTRSLAYGSMGFGSFWTALKVLHGVMPV